MLHLNCNVFFITIFVITFIQNSYQDILQSSFTNDGRIVGGDEITIEQFPFIVSIINSNSHHCGGSIIRPNVVITAAHCLDQVDASSLTIRAGSTFTTSGGQLIQVKKTIMHQYYNPNNVHNDIGVIMLETNVIFDESVQSIKLPRQNEALPDSGQVAGWGLLKSNSIWHPNIKLNAVKVPVVPHYLCNLYYLYSINQHTMFCAGDFYNGGKDACSGDSGGPFEAHNKLFGVVSWGMGCAERFFPGVYTKVPTYVDWIEQTIKENT